MNRSLLITSVLTLLAACETNAPAPPAPLPAEQFGVTRATSVCSGAGARCAAVGVTGIDEAACTTKLSIEYQTSLDEDLARPNATYDPISAARCARSSRVHFTRDDLSSDSDLLQCITMVGGLGDYGFLNVHRVCLTDAGCAPGYSCYHGMDGTQVPVGWCKMIGAHSEAGMGCTTTREDNGSSTTYGWTEGAACYESDGLFCGGSSDYHECMARVGKDATCSYDVQCVYGTVCRPACAGAGCVEQTCQLPGKNGDICFSKHDCTDGLRCNAVAGATGTCEPKLQDGVACSEDDDCASFFCSDELGVCASAVRADCESIVRTLAE